MKIQFLILSIRYIYAQVDQELEILIKNLEQELNRSPRSQGGNNQNAHNYDPNYHQNAQSRRYDAQLHYDQIPPDNSG